MAFSTGARIRFHSRPLLDVLEEVPLDVVETNFWLSLPPISRGSFRQVSHRSQCLADALRSSAIVSLCPADKARVPQPSALRLMTPWAAYLGRLPHLTTLELHSWDSEADLQTAMLHFGGAARSQVVSLQLSGTALSLGTGCAVRVAFPHLQRLFVFGPLAPQPGQAPLKVEHALFLPLSIIELEVGDPDAPARLTEDALLSLGALTQLQNLTLCVETLPQQHMPLFAAFLHLRSLVLDCEPPTFSAANAAPLFTLTRLTCLVLVVRPDDCDNVMSSATLHAPTIQHGSPTAVAALGDLVDLRCLQLCDDFVADDGAYDQVCRLTRLTELTDCHIATTRPQPGGLPLLLELSFSWLRPDALLRSLLPLAPLPSLTSLSTNGLWVELDMEGGDGGDDARRQTVALKAAVQLLAAAPRLPVQTEVTLGCRALSLRKPSLSGQLCLAQVVEGLGPWVRSLVTLHVFNVGLDTFGGAALGAAFPTLRHLALTLRERPAAGESDADLQVMDVAEHFVALTRLDVVGLAGGQAASTWLGLATVRSKPLLVVVVGSARPDATMLGVCEQVQGLRFGRRHITWAVFRVGCEGEHDLL